MILGELRVKFAYKNNVNQQNCSIMEENRKLIWIYRSTRRQNLDNDYYFYEDETILHHYDQTMTKWDIEENVLSSDISVEEKERILMKCKAECSTEIVERIRAILRM